MATIATRVVELSIATGKLTIATVQTAVTIAEPAPADHAGPEPEEPEAVAAVAAVLVEVAAADERLHHRDR